jgi:hypothetical protein
MKERQWLQAPRTRTHQNHHPFEINPEPAPALEFTPVPRKRRANGSTPCGNAPNHLFVGQWQLSATAGRQRKQFYQLKRRKVPKALPPYGT